MAVANDHPVALHLNGEYDQFYEILARKKKSFSISLQELRKDKNNMSLYKKNTM